MTASFWLWIADVVLGVVSGAVGVVRGAASIEQFRASSAAMPTGAAETSALTNGLIAGAVLGVLSAALYVLLALALRRGRNWARVGLCVLGGVAVVSTGYRLAAIPITPLATISLLQCVLVVTAAVLCFRPPASAFFRAHRHRPTANAPVG